jgi:ubiquinone/menaquinone biosynthesis C-methylase UbiE
MSAENQVHPQTKHAVMATPTHDEFSRQEFVRSYKNYLVQNVHSGNQTRYEKIIKPKFEKTHNRAPKDRFEVGKEMVHDPYYQMFSSLLRTSQEMMWSSCQVPVNRDLENLNEKIKIPKGTKTLGSLKLDTKLQIPRYHTAVDIHCQPGGYHSEVTEDDASAGLVYDRAVHIYAMGQLGPYNDDIGASILLWLKNNHPTMAPRKILDMGCSVGHSTVPYAQAFPDAEVHGIDVAAPMLRYAHARAEDLGEKVHFSQQNAEQTNFKSGTFDLIVSHILLHETSQKAIHNIVKECHRLLKPGGLMVHGETPPYKNMGPFDAFMLDWDTRNNNEPFWARSHEIDLEKLSKKGGFDPKNQFETLIPSALQVAEAKRSKVFQGGDFGGGGLWFIYGNMR